jgi:hypothetical protein
MSNDFDATRLSLLLNDLRLPAVKQIWPTFAKRSDKEGWPAARLLMALAEHEIAESDRRRIERHLRDAKLLPGKTLENFDFDAVPMVSRAQVSALCAGDGWLRNGANLILMGPPSGGKSHLSSARPEPAGQGMEGPVRPHHRPRTAVTGRAPRAGSRIRPQSAGSLRPALKLTHENGRLPFEEEVPKWASIVPRTRRNSGRKWLRW